MRLQVGEIVGGWKIIEILDKSAGSIIAIVTNKLIDGEWVIKKYESRTEFDERNIYELYLKKCNSAIKIPSLECSDKLEIRGKNWFIMRKYAGDILKKLLYAKHYFTKFTIDVINFLRHIHMQGIVHGDMKTKNILYNERPPEFCVCDYEYMRKPSKLCVYSERSYISYYYLFLGIPYLKPHFSYRADLTAFGYILWKVISADRGYELKFDWQDLACELYSNKNLENKYEIIESKRLAFNKTMPEAISNYFAIIEEVDWYKELPPDGAIYDNIIRLHMKVRR